MVDIAAAARVSRPTLYRCYSNRDALLQALMAEAVDEIGRRLDDAGLDRCAAPEALERIVRAILTVGDRYTVLLNEQVQHDVEAARPRRRRPPATGHRARHRRGRPPGDLPVEILDKLLGGVIGAAVRVVGESRLGLEETAAATTALFLEGARRP
jgi:AcrR family transcriptional regulator